MAATGHHLEDTMATCHQPDVAREVAETSFNTQCTFRLRLTLEISASLLRQRNTCSVLAWEACEGPNTPDQTRRLMAETGHHLEDISFTWYSERRLANHPAFQQVWKEYGVTITGATSAVCS